MKKSFIPLFALTFVALVGCATPSTQVESNRARYWNGKISRPYVQVTYMREWGDEFNDAFEDRLGRILTDCGLNVKVVRRHSLDLDGKTKLVTEMRNFNADALITVWATGGGLNRDGVVINRAFAAQVDVVPARTVWKANFTVWRGGTAVESLTERGTNFAIELTNRMKQDRLLDSCAELPVIKKGLLPSL